MARASALLGALWTSVRREGKTLGSFTGNNLFLVGLVFLFFGDPGVFAALSFIVAVVIFFPLTTDPLRLMPAERLGIWPLSKRERILVRLGSPWLNPMTWIIVALVAWRGISRGMWALLAGMFVVGFVASSLPLDGGVLRAVPGVPGVLRELVRKNLRQHLSTLDFYAALLLSLGACLFRVRGLLPAEAHLPLTLIVMLAFSSNAQCLFGLDGEGGMTRYHLLPLRGWQVLVAKDVAYLILALALTAPLSPRCGAAAALVSLAFGHIASVSGRIELARWRFSTSASFTAGILQVFLMTVAAASADSYGAPVLAACVALFGLSTWWLGRMLEEQS